MRVNWLECCHAKVLQSHLRRCKAHLQQEDRGEHGSRRIASGRVEAGGRAVARMVPVIVKLCRQLCLQEVRILPALLACLGKVLPPLVNPPFQPSLSCCFFLFLIDPVHLEALCEAMPAMGMQMQQGAIAPNLVVVGVLVAVPMNPQPLFLATCPVQQPEPFRTPPQSPSGAPTESSATEVPSRSTAPQNSQWKKKKGSQAQENPIPILKQHRWGGQIAQFPMKRPLREALAAAERKKASASN